MPPPPQETRPYYPAYGGLHSPLIRRAISCGGVAMILSESPFHLSILRWRPRTLTWWPWPPPDLCKRLKWWKIRQWQCLTCLTEVFKAGDVFCLPKGVVFSKGWRVREKKDCKHIVWICVYTVDGWNPANQLRLVYSLSHFLQVFYIPAG